MAEAKKETKSSKVNEYGQTEEQFLKDHGGRKPDEVNPPTEEPDEAHQAAKQKARWG